METVSQLGKGIPTYDSPILAGGFDLNSITPGERIKGVNRQFVQFYKKIFSVVFATKVKVNEKTGSSIPVETATKEVEREMVKIITPGDIHTVLDVVAEDYHRREHWRQYKAFRDGTGAPLGLSLDDCSYINPNVATELRYRGCHTQEQLADASDFLCEQVANGFEIREFARGAVKAERLNAGQNQVNLLKDELAGAQALITELRQAQEAMRLQLVDLQGKPIEKNKLGRPKKETVNTLEA